MFYDICASYDNFDHIYTDGSNMGDRVASAAISSNMVRSTQLPNNASIFRADLYAVTLVSRASTAWPAVVVAAFLLRWVHVYVVEPVVAVQACDRVFIASWSVTVAEPYSEVSANGHQPFAVAN